MTVNRTMQLINQGKTPRGRSSESNSAALVQVRHGAWADEPASNVLEQHLQLIAGTVPILGNGTVLSHASAGVLHKLPTWESILGRVTVLRRSPGHGSRRRNLHVRSAPLTEREVGDVDGYPATILERTAIDLACTLPYERAVAVLDAALHLKADPALMAEIMAAARRRRGAPVARSALAFADGRAESVAESISRVRMAGAGLPAPNLQLNVYDAFGSWLARTDFAWEEQGVLGEFDGRIKYTGAPDDVARAVMNEKHREDRLREAGWVLVRWGWTDIANQAGLRRRIEAAFAQANPAAITGHVEPS